MAVPSADGHAEVASGTVATREKHLTHRSMFPEKYDKEQKELLAEFANKITDKELVAMVIAE